MSGSQPPPQGGGTNDPSMEDILASIRRILSEEEPAAPTSEPAAEPAAPLPDKSDDVLVLDSSMLVPEEETAEPLASVPEREPDLEPEPEPAPAPAPAIPVAELMPPSTGLLAPETEAAATNSVGTLVRTLASGRTLQVHRGGPTIEDLVREELRPLLKQWLDANLPDLVERLVRAEIERVVHRAMP